MIPPIVATTTNRRYRHSARLVTGLLMLAALFGPSTRAEDAQQALLAAVAKERLRPPAPRLERQDFLLRPRTFAPVLSPDGRHVAYLRVAGHAQDLWWLAADSGTPQLLLPHAQADALAWSHDGRWLLLVSARQVYALAVAGQGDSGIVSTLGDRAGLEWLAVDPVQPAAIVLLESLPASSGTGRWRLVRADMQGRRELLHESSERILDFAFDRSGRLAYVGRLHGEQLLIHRIDAAGTPIPLIRCPPLQRCSFLPVSTARNELLLQSDLQGDRSRLLRIDAGGDVHAWHDDPRGEADLDELVLDPRDGQPLIAIYRSTVSAVHGLDAATARHLDAIRAQVSGTDLHIGIGRGDAAHWLVGERDGDLQLPRWHLYDPRDGTLRRVLDEPPVRQHSEAPARQIPDRAFARRIAITWTASDGMRLHGFLMLPPGADPARLPLIASVHGGPWNHARPEFGVTSQFLVNRGYAVFEPNFRGSTGHGRNYLLAAGGDYGNGRVQQDIVDGVRHLLAAGIGDADRVGIIGASFGGYATLLGLTHTPDLFKVGVAFVPPPDFAWSLRWMARSEESLNLASRLPFKTWARLVGLDMDDPNVMSRLQSQSPLTQAGRLRGRLLILAGGEDRRVAVRGIIEYAARLKLLGKDVSLFLDPQAGHSNDHPLAREAQLYLLERALHPLLGGVTPTAPEAGLRAYIEARLPVRGSAVDAVSARP